ncbi:MAG: D-glycerate dehydrogenase [Planctomycetes bacterium]|nr:D-glycerate dehydrogenase [Planctomycetota bacterium]
MSTLWPGRAAPPIVFLTRKLPDVVKARLADAGVLPRTWGGDRPPSREEIAGVAAEAEGMISLVTDPITGPLLEALPRLQVVANFAVGVDNVDLATATRLGILVTNTPDVLTNACAEFTIALLLATCRRLAEAERQVRRGAWTGWAPTQFLGMEIQGKTLGIVGAGRIGQAVGRKASALGLCVIYASRTEKPDFERESGAQRVELDELFATSDIVSLHCPLRPDTRHLVNATRLALMKPGAYLLNTTRGPVVDEAALAEALARGRLAGAGLDVFEGEPRVHPLLLTLENVVLAPHVASATVEARNGMGTLCAENVLTALQGKMPAQLVNPDVWPHRRGARV